MTTLPPREPRTNRDRIESPAPAASTFPRVENKAGAGGLRAPASIAIQYLINRGVKRDVATQVVSDIEQLRVCGFVAWAHVYKHAGLSEADCTRFVSTHYPQPVRGSENGNR